MFEGLFGTFLAKAVMSVAAAFGLFGGLAVVGVLPVIGGNASDTVIVDAIAFVETSGDIVAVNPVVELPSVQGITSQLPVVDDLASIVPGVDGITSTNRGAIDSDLPVLGLVGTLLNSVTGTVQAVLGSLPVVGGVLPEQLPLVPEVGIPAASASAPGLKAISGPLENVPNAASIIPSLPLVGDLDATTHDLPLVNDLLRTAQGAVEALLPGLELLVT
jgi:hypothetical protein